MGLSELFEANEQKKASNQQNLGGPYGDYIENLLHNQMNDLVGEKYRTPEEMSALGISSSNKNLNAPANVIKEQAFERGYEDPSKYVVSSGYGNGMSDAIQKRANERFFDNDQYKKMQELNRIKELAGQYKQLGQRVAGMTDVKMKDLVAKRGMYQAQEQARANTINGLFGVFGTAMGM